MRKKYPIHQTALGPDYMKPAIVKNDPRNDGKDTRYVTHNPVPEKERAILFYKGKSIPIRIWLNWYTNPNLTIIEILEK